jgi:helix-turn-helix resolvase-like protein
MGATPIDWSQPFGRSAWRWAGRPGPGSRLACGCRPVPRPCSGSCERPPCRRPRPYRPWASTSGPGGGGIAMARSWSTSRTTASSTCCRTARPPASRPGWPSIQRSPSSAAIGATFTPPAAVQVVDRFHLVHNLRQALEAFLLDHRPALQDAAVSRAIALMPTAGSIPVTPRYRGRRRDSKPAPLREEAARPPRHARWVAIYEAVQTLRAQGTSITTIARQLGISRPTVSADLRRAMPPGPRRLQRPPSARVLTPYIPYLLRRWRESGAESRQLWREIQALGYTHAARTVRRFITRLRRASEGGYAPEVQASPYTRPQGPSPRAVSLRNVSACVPAFLAVYR